MANDSNRFPLQNAIKKILDNPSSRPPLEPNPEPNPDGGFPWDSIGVFPDDWGEGKQMSGKMSRDSQDVVIQGLDKELPFGISGSPAVIVFNGKLYCVHEGKDDNGWLWVCSFDGENWSEDKQLPFGTAGPPALAEYLGKLYCVHEGQGGDGWLWVCSFDGENWSEDKQLPFGTGVKHRGILPAALAVYQGILYCLHEGQGEDGWLWVCSFDGENWSEDKQLPFGTTGAPALFTLNNRLHCLHEGKNDNGWLWHTSFDGKNWSKDVELQQHNGGGRIGTYGPPGVVTLGSLLYSVHQGQNNTGSLWITSTPADRQQPHHPQWFEERGRNSYYYLSTGTGFGADPNEGIATSKTITVDPETVNPGTPFLLANLTQSSKSIAFPTGAMLTIKAPDGTIYNQEESGGGSIAIKSGSSLQSLLIKEPIAGDYHITLTVPPHVAFFFAFETLPSRDIVDTIQGKQGLQKRASSGAGGIEEVARLIASIWLNVEATQPQNLTFLEEPTGYLTASSLSVLHTPTPTTVTAATQTITQNIQWPPDINDFAPPAIPIPAPINGPVIEFVRNPAGALLWLHGRIIPNHLGTGTNPNDATRDFARRLGLGIDDAGHVIGARLGGLGNVEWNIFPQNRNFNRGAYNIYVERVLADAVRRYGPIEVWFRFHYDNPLLPNRPDRFDFIYRLPDGQYRYNDLLNPEHVPPGA